MMETYHEDAGQGEVEVFYSMEEALKWLGREEEKHQNHENRTDQSRRGVSQQTAIKTFSENDPPGQRPPGQSPEAAFFSAARHQRREKIEVCERGLCRLITDRNLSSPGLISNTSPRSK
jgi:hypothetical protein